MDWREKEITEKQKNYIMEMTEFSEYPLPPFKGKTRGEASNYINKYNKIAHESLWGILNGY
jgi:hypothetical protein